MQLDRRGELVRARRSAAIAGTMVAIVVAILAVVGSAILATLSVITILIGIVFSLTVIGLIVGIPLILVGCLGVIGAAIGGSGGLFFALLLGAGTGFAYYRYRLRALDRHY